MVKLDELQALIDRLRDERCTHCSEAAAVIAILRDEVLALRRVIEEAEDYLSNADHDAAQALLWETLHPGSAAHDAAIDAALAGGEHG